MVNVPATTAKKSNTSMKQDSRRRAVRKTSADLVTAGGLSIGMPQALRTNRPDREARAFLRWVNLYAWLPIEDRSVRAQRAIWRFTAQAMGRRPAVDSVITQFIDGPGGPIEMRVFSPAPSKTLRPAFLWCHGGGFMVGDLDTGDSICRSIARSAGCIVVAVRYRLAPEHPLTACREDVLAALQWLAAHGGALGIDGTRLAIGGDSAGGNISAAVAQHAARHGPKLSLQVLAYPATDLVQKFASASENAKGYMVSTQQIDKIAATVKIPPSAATDPWLSPRLNGELQGVAPALLVSAGFDPIRDDGLDYAARLRAADVPVQLLHYAGQFHGFLNFDSLVGAGADGLVRIGAALADAFNGKPVDCTIEIADKLPSKRRRLAAAAGEVATTSLTGWMTVERLGATLFGRLSPRAARIARRWLESRFVPGATVRRSTMACTGRLAPRQTYPAG
jgi:acetyl esterase